MKPFEAFPHQGQKRLGPLVEKNGSRHGYGLELRKATGQTNCACCDFDLTETLADIGPAFVLRLV
jgi:hypothetical protein